MSNDFYAFATPGQGALSFQKIEGGLVALPLTEVILGEGVVDGDRVILFMLPGGKTSLQKDPEGTVIKLTSAYVLFDNEVNIQEV